MDAVQTKIEWKEEARELKDLIPADYNPRALTREEALQLRNSLEKFGYVDPIVINTNNVIIGGHQRYFIMKEFYQVCMVRVPSRRLNEEEERELNLRLNKNTGHFDFDKLAEMGEEMLMNVGFSARDLDDIFQLEPTEEILKNDTPPPEVLAKPGDLYLLGPHRLMCGDSTNPAHVARLFDNQLADMVFTDPPYNVDYSGRGLNTSNTIMNDNLSRDQFQAFIQEVFHNMHAIMKPGAVYYICSGWSCFGAFDEELINEGFYRAGVIIWKKDVASMGWNDFRYKHEWILVGKRKEVRVKGVPILYGWKDGSHYFRDTRDEVDVWEVPRKFAGHYKHPTEKPVWLVEKAIADSTERGQIVADLFSGSGSSLIAADRLKRIFYGMEKDPHYIDVIIDRWQKYTGLEAELVHV